ncbi:MAG TPA: hypothetical protein DIW54_00525 [Chitinophagaceae bacterium]|nr:hypothetical protein [Chitinophagaceae bacterium]HCT21889.1 hypothetical protein [Chitinophagaceae bacterium]
MGFETAILIITQNKTSIGLIYVVELSVAQDDRIKSAAMMAINYFMIELDVGNTSTLSNARNQ